MNFKKITVFAGHYGSGKTNLAVNLARLLRAQGKDVSLVDLDVVNPYFRSKDSEAILEQDGIRLIASQYANSNLDIPAVPAETYSIFNHDRGFAVVDLGGDDRGAYAMGRFAELFEEMKDYDMLLVVNQFRPDTATPEKALPIIREIEDACHVRFTGVVNNTNLGNLTEKSQIEASVAYAERICELTGLPLKFTAYHETLEQPDVPLPFPIKIYAKEIWKI